MRITINKLHINFTKTTRTWRSNHLFNFPLSFNKSALKIFWMSFIINFPCFLKTPMAWVKLSLRYLYFTHKCFKNFWISLILTLDQHPLLYNIRKAVISPEICFHYYYMKMGVYFEDHKYRSHKLVYLVYWVLVIASSVFYQLYLDNQTHLNISNFDIHPWKVCKRNANNNKTIPFLIKAFSLNQGQKKLVSQITGLVVVLEQRKLIIVYKENCNNLSCK